jgi:hypothetical protein
MPVIKVYTSSFNYALGAGLGAFSNFKIESFSRELQLRSILLDWRIVNNTTNAVLPFDSPGLQKMALQIGDLNNQISSVFIPVLGINPVFNGIFLQIYRPGQYFFNSFFIKNSISFNLSVQNDDAASGHTHALHLTAEITEKIIYQ